MTSRERVRTAVGHQRPDRLPVDFLATTEIWEKLLEHFGIAPAVPDDSLYFDPAWEEVLRRLEVDCRVLSYDQFVAPPLDKLPYRGKVEWWDVRSRSTPARMWRLALDSGEARDIFGRLFRKQRNAKGEYEENVTVLGSAESVDDLKLHAWPEPDWWDFSGMRAAVGALRGAGVDPHIRYRMGSIFEIAWQLRGMDTFMMDLALEPEMAAYLLGRLTDIIAEVSDRALAAAGDAVDMVYFYDDVAANNGLMISEAMWEEFILPCHRRLCDMARKHGKKIMYHSDGDLGVIIDRLIDDVGIDVLNPLQPNTVGMEPGKLKKNHGDRLAFHGGIDIIELLPKGTPEQVAEAVRSISGILGDKGGYIMASSHHIQPDTPLANVLAMYDLGLRS